MAPFPPTRQSLIVRARHEEPGEQRAALGALVEAYWKPVYKYVRAKRGIGREDAEDLTQEFFGQAIARGLLQRYEPARARFRTYLRTCLDGFLVNEWKTRHRLKRGGGTVQLDFTAAEQELELGRGPVVEDPDLYFRREWVRHLFAVALARLRTQLAVSGRAARFTLFERHELEEGAGRPTYAELAAEMGISVTQVTNELFAARRGFRRGILDLLRETTGSEAEFRSEAEALFGTRFE